MNVDIVSDRAGSTGRGDGRIEPPLQLVAFVVAGQRYAVDVASTLRVLPMVAVSPLPRSPSVVLGAINLHGRVVPVLDLRRRLGLPAHEYGLQARLLVAETSRRVLALVADEVPGVIEVPASDVVAPTAVLPEIGEVSGIATVADGLLLIHDLESFLSLEEERQLGEALEGAQE